MMRDPAQLTCSIVLESGYRPLEKGHVEQSFVDINRFMSPAATSS